MSSSSRRRPFSSIGPSRTAKLLSKSFASPHALCTDGRALSQVEPGWESPLIGVPKEIYEFWRRQLKPKGYHIRFEIIDYPVGMPGDVGIALSWKTAEQK